MTRDEFLNLVKSKIVILDGSTGRNLQKRGMPVGVCPEEWILNNPRVLIELQREFLEAGTDILLAPTFTANRIKLAEYGLSEQIEQINKNLVRLSKQAIAEYREKTGDTSKKYIAADIAMTGRQVQPLGDLPFEELVDIYKEQYGYLLDEGIDLLMVETMMSLQECRAALLAAKESCELPVMISLTFDSNGRTLYGTDAKTAVIVLQSMGADAVGINCSVGPDKMHDLVTEMKNYAYVPILVKPNAGIPQLVNDETVFPMGPDEFAREMKVLALAGANIIGGCCGTTPEHIRQMVKLAGHLPSEPPRIKGHVRALTTEQNTLEISLDRSLLIIGERINPTGKSQLQAQLRQKDMALISEMAQEQAALGADILDINVGMSSIDEKELMLMAMEEALQAGGLPLCIDSSHVSVIEAALRLYPGRALINSISLEKEKFERLIPLAKKYGAMFILLPVSDKGLPKDMEERKEIINSILMRAYEEGLTGEDIIVDGLVNTVAAYGNAARDTLATISYCRNELGLATVVGLSNISFGMPQRQIINSTFLSLAVSAGLTMAIANPSQDLLMATAMAADLLMAKEDAAIRYIERVNARPPILGDGRTSGPEKSAQAAADAAKVQAGICAQDGNNAKIGNNAQTGTNAQIGNNAQTGDIQQTDNQRQTDKQQADEGLLSAADEKEAHSRSVYNAVVKGNKRNIIQLVDAALAAGISPGELIDKTLIAAINEVGRLYDQQIYFLPQLIAGAEAMKLAMEHVEPMLAKGGQASKKGTVVIATVAGDIHDIGKNLVALMLKNYGYRVIDLGKDVPTDRIIQAAKAEKADIIALSALMTTTMIEMKNVVAKARAEGIKAKIMIGGAVVTEGYAREIGADGYSENAQAAVALADRLMDEIKTEEGKA